jgi:hypothetical protein
LACARTAAGSTLFVGDDPTYRGDNEVFLCAACGVRRGYEVSTCLRDFRIAYTIDLLPLGVSETVRQVSPDHFIC